MIQMFTNGGRINHSLVLSPFDRFGTVNLPDMYNPKQCDGDGPVHTVWIDFHVMEVETSLVNRLTCV